MWTHRYTHRTDADPARLWELLADVDGWVRWNDGIERIELAGPLVLGATFRMTPPGEDTVTSTVVALEPPYVLSDNTELDGIAVRVEHRLQPHPDGGTTIAYEAIVSGDAPDDVLAEIGTGVTSDFPDVMANLAAAAQR